VKKVRLKSFLFVVAAACTLECRADVITFDMIPPPGNAPQSGTLTTQGFNFTSPSFHIIDQPGLCAGGCVDDGTQYLAVAGPSLDSAVVVTNAGGSVFSVTGLDAAKLFLTPGGLFGSPNADTLDLLGTLAGGSSVSVSLTLPAEGSFGTFTLAGFSDLTSLTISGTGGGSDDASWAVDNLVVTSVPEPSTTGLLIGGLMLSALVVRRRLACQVQ
jgi:hypothetical protein